MSTHTKGPWEVAMGEVYAVRDSEGGRIALVTNLRGPHGLGGRRDEEEAAANTRLIAEAPALYEAAREFVKWAEQSGHRAQPGSPVERARAAIARVSGGAA